MAMQSVFYDTLLPEGVINLMEEDLKVFDNNLEDSIPELVVEKVVL
jgi:hypothetical protein